MPKSSPSLKMVEAFQLEGKLEQRLWLEQHLQRQGALDALLENWGLYCHTGESGGPEDCGTCASAERHYVPPADNLWEPQPPPPRQPDVGNGIMVDNLWRSMEYVTRIAMKVYYVELFYVPTSRGRDFMLRTAAARSRMPIWYYERELHRGRSIMLAKLMKAGVFT